MAYVYLHIYNLELKKIKEYTLDILIVIASMFWASIPKVVEIPTVSRHICKLARFEHRLSQTTCNRKILKQSACIQFYTTIEGQDYIEYAWQF